ncbi:VOC family protein [Streptomyces sp. URMC 123]|uniref:VOC family protein n=1 Tax=Streptomyces sp. URMC 123 TaxID=3423403 RepID=UPI003F19AD21
MLTSPHLPGGPNWLELDTPDPEAAAAFYGGVLGWRFRPAGPGAPGRGVFRLDGRIAAGLGPPALEGDDASWTVCFGTADADATAKAVAQAGGTVLVAPYDVPGAGRTARFADPSGCRFAVWQPGALPGLEVANVPDSATWIELYTADSAAAKDFYRAVFPWVIDWDIPIGAHTYSIISPSGNGEQGPHGAIMQLNADNLAAGWRPGWHPYFEVRDCDAAVAAATERGATVFVPAIDVPGVGRVAMFLDPLRARFAVMRSTTG